LRLADGWAYVQAVGPSRYRHASSFCVGADNLRQIHFIIPGNIDALTGGYIYDKHIINGLSAQKWHVSLHSLSARFPFPSDHDLEYAYSIIKKIPDHSLVVIDGLALAPLASQLCKASKRLRIVALVHHPVAEETGLTLAQQLQFKKLEQVALSVCSQISVTSAVTAKMLIEEYYVNPASIEVIEPGIAKMPVSIGSNKASFNLLCIATLIPRKGHEVLLHALASLQEVPWNLDCIGDLDRDKQTSIRVKNCATKLGIRDRINFLGNLNVSKMRDALRSADLFVLASYHEGYGMALAEALGSGIPIVATSAGAIIETVPQKAGLLVPAGDSRAFASALSRFFHEPRLRRRLTEGARGCRRTQRSWEKVVYQMEVFLLETVG